MCGRAEQTNKSHRNCVFFGFPLPAEIVLLRQKVNYRVVASNFAIMALLSTDKERKLLLADFDLNIS